MLIYLYHPQSSVIIFIQDCLYAGRFSRSAVTKQKNVVGSPSLYECLGILNQLCLLHLIAHEIFQADMLYPGNRFNYRPAAVFIHINVKRFIQAEFTDPEFPIEFRHRILERRIIFRALQRRRQLHNPVADSPVEDPALLRGTLVIFHQLPDSAGFFIQNSDIAGKQFSHETEIMGRQHIKRASHRAFNLT